MTYASELAFIDPGIDPGPANLAYLLAGLRPDVEAVLLDAEAPAAGQIARTLEHRRDLRAVHILAHGSPGEVGFAAGPVSLETLGDHAADLAAIGRALGAGGNLRLWSCRTGEGERGEIFVSRLARATGATVAAATGLVGAAARGGRWALDAGADEAQPPLTPAGQARYDGVMAVTINSASITSIATDSGASASDFVTNDTILQFNGSILTSSGSGSGTLGIWLSGGQYGTGNGGKGTFVGSTTVSGNGAWSLFIGSFPDGSYTIHITNGTATGASDLATHSLVIDTAAPTTPSAPDLIAASDSGISSIDNITSDTTPTVTGTGEANARVTLYDTDGTTVLGTATANGAGSWTITSSALADGSHTLTAKQADLAGNTSGASSGLAVTIDTTAPTAPSAPDLTAAADRGASNTDNITGQSVLPFTGSGAEAGATVTLYDTDGTTVLGTATANASGNWSITSASLADGVHSLTAKQLDTAGNSSTASPALSVTVDLVAPPTPATPDLVAASDSGASSTDNITNDSTPTFTGSGAEPGARLQLFADDILYATATVDGSGNWTITGPALADGVHSMVARQVDVAGNPSGLSAPLAVTIETTAAALGAPDLVAASDTGSSTTDNLTNDKTPTFSGSGAAAGATVTLFDGTTAVGTATADGSGNWTVTSSTLADSEHGMRVQQTDLAGNVGAQSLPLGVIIDKTVPATPGEPDLVAASDSGSSSTDNITNDKTPTVTGSGAEPGATVILRDESTRVDLGTTIADASGNWTITSPAMANGTHTLKVRVTDAAGNTSPNSPALGSTTHGLTIDTAAPAAPNAPDLDAASDSGASSTDNVTSDTTPTVSGSGAVAGGLVTLYDTDGTTVLGTATADGTGNWTINPLLALGTHTLTVKQTDIAGNTSVASPGLVVSIDRTAPNAPIITQVIDDAPPHTGTISDGGVTNDTTPTVRISLSGTGAAAGDSAQILDGLYYQTNPPPLGSVTLTAADIANGYVDVTSSAFGQTTGGITSFVALIVDAAGNKGAVSNFYTVTLDTIGETPTAPDLLASSDTGASSTDNITKDATPTFSGAAEAGGTVTLYDTDGTTVLGTAGSNGNWTITSSTLADGAHTLRVKQTDAAGNTSSFSDPITVTIDTAPRAAPGAPDLVAASDTGASSTDNLTNDTTPTFSGSGVEAGATVRLFDGATAVGSATADGSGNWTVTSSALAEGGHTITVKQIDLAGTASAASPGLAVTIDTTPPAAPGAPDLVAASDTGSSSTDNLTNDTTPTFSGSGVEAGATVRLFDGATAVGSATADGSGNWIVTSSALAEGGHTITVKQTDLAGNISAASPGLAVTIDTTGPAAPGAPDLAPASDSGKSSTDDITSDKTPTVSGGGAAAGATVTLYDTDGTTVLGTVAADGSGNWTITSTTLADGAHTLTARQADVAGNSGAASPALVVTIDSAAALPGKPDLTAASDTGISSTDNVTNDTSPTFTGTAEPGATVKLYSQDVPPPPSNNNTALELPSPTTLVGSATADASGNWTITDPSAFSINGGLEYYATQTDVAGNTSGNSSRLTVTFDISVPGAPSAPNLTAASDSGASSTDDITNDSTPTVTGTGGGAGGVVTLYDTNGTTVLGTATADSSGNWTITSSTLAAGTHTLKARQSDVAGNVSFASPNLAVTIDKTAAAPSAPDLQAASDSGASSTDNVTNVATPTVSGSGAEAGATVTLFDSNGTTVLGSAIADAGGGWTITSASLGAGVHTLTAKQTDIAGNASAASAALAVTIDKTANAPGAPDLAASSDSGASSTDNVTNVATPTFTGNGAESGATVRLYDTDGTTVLGTAIANGSGNWTITGPTLSEGAHTLTVKQTDVAGNVSGASPSLAVTIDKTALTAPAIVQAVDDVAPVTGAIANGGSTDDATPTVRVKFAGLGAHAGDSVQLFDGGSALGGAYTLTAGDIGNGYVDITPAALADGTHGFTAKLTDVAGNASAATPFSFVVTIGAAAAALAIVSFTDDSGAAGDHVTSDTTPTLSGTAQADSTVEIFQDGVSIGTTPADGTGHWSLATGALVDGTYQFTVTATDALNNTTSPSDAFAVTVDATAPGAPTVDGLVADTGTAGDQLTSDQSPTLSGTAEAGSTVELSRDGNPVGTTTADGSGHWSLATGILGDGTYQFTATATDAAGSASGASEGFAVTIDATAPDAPAIVAVADDGGAPGDGVTNDATPRLSGTAEAGSIVEVFQDGSSIGTVAADGSGQWSLDAGTPGDGTYHFTATATDAAGNASGASEAFAVTIDTSAPDGPTIAAAADDSGTAGDGVTTDSTPILSGSAEASSTVEVFQDGTSIGTTTADGDGHWSLAAGTLGDGTYQFTATSTDAAGNASEASAAFAVTIDTAAPATPTIDAVADDSGIVGDGLTSDATPTLSGTAEAGSTVEVFKDGSSIGTTTADVSGHWSLAAGSLGDGTYDFTATATDAAGNASGASEALAVTIDATAPGAPTIAAVADDSGLAGDGVTSDATPLLSGTAEAGTTVEVFKDGASIGTTTADGDGQWSLAAGTLGDGTYHFTATATDTAGGVSGASEGFAVIVDTASPAAPTIDAIADDSGAAGDGATNDTTPALSGTAEAGSTVEIFQDGSSIGTTTADGTGRWTLAAGTLGDGTYHFTATATDAAGNTGDSSADFAVTIDTQAPAIPTIDAVAADSGLAGDGVTNDTTPALSGTAEAGSTVEVFKDGTSIGTTTAGEDGQWSLAAGTLGDGTYHFTATATNAAGNASAASSDFAVTIDSAAPAVPTIDAVADDSGAAGDHVTNETTPMLSGAADAGSTVEVVQDGSSIGTTTADGTGHWSLAAGTLNDGTYHFTATATDAAGNVGDASSDFAVTVDTQAPAMPTIDAVAVDSGLAGDGVTNDGAPSLSGTAEAGSTVEVFRDGSSIGTTTAGDGGQWSLPAGTLIDGTYHFTATATDAAGNASDSSADFAVTIDTHAPAIPTIDAVADDSGAAGDHVTNDTTPTLSGAADAGSTVEVFQDGTSIGTTMADGTGHWSLTAGTLNDGTYHFTATATDAAGNVGVATADFDVSFHVTIDSAAAAPGTPDLQAASDSGLSSADDLTAVATPTVTGDGAESGAMVTLYDSDGTTVLGTTTADDSGSWTIVSAALGDGAHALTAGQTDIAGNASGASPALVVTIDTGAAAPGTPDLANGSDSGSSNTDNVTKVTTPTFNGSGAEAGATVTLYDGDATAVGSTTADGSGNWSITSATLGAGDHTLTARQTDGAGNTSLASPGLAVTIDATAPNAPAITQVTDNAGPVTGTVANGGSTDDTTPTVRIGLAGTGAVVGDGVQLFDGANALGGAVALMATDIANGYLDITLAALGQGVYSFDANITDAAGNASLASAGYAVTIAGPPPVAAITGITTDTGASSSDGTTSDKTLAIAGTATAGSTVEVFRNGTAIGTTTADGTGHWTFDSTGTALHDGLYQFTAKATVGGNAGAPSSPLLVTVDTHVDTPVVMGFTPDSNIPSDGITNANQLVVSGTAEANSMVKIYDGATLLGTVKAGAFGLWSFTAATLADGTHGFTATATDLAGNVSGKSASLTAKVDTVAPAVAFANDVHNANNGATLSGTAEAGSVVAIYDGNAASPLGTVTAAANGTWSFTTGVLSNSTHSFTATATDAAGNKGTAPGLALYGSSAGDTLAGGTGNDLLTGNGASDTFVFGPHFGKDVVTDFVATGSAHDVIQIDHTVFANFAGMLAHAAQVGSDVVITADPLDVITLKNVSKASLTASDFHFV